jgi:DNA-binding transcriptional LysR family regulator
MIGMQDLNDLCFFARVVEHGGFAAAGRALGVPKSRLSRRVALLEKRLGVRLIHRSTRHFRVTDLGRIYHEHCLAMLAEAEAAQEAIDAVQAQPRGTIRLTCPVALLHAHVGSMLSDFMVRYPQVKIYMEATNRRVDVLTERVDMAIRVRPAPLADSGLVMRVLSDRGQCLVAAPALVQRFGLPAEPAELPKMPSLGLGFPEENFRWVLHGPNEATASVEHEPRYVTTDMVALRDAALAGIGIVQLPVLMVQSYLAAGSLISVLPNWVPRREIIHVVFPSRAGLLPAIRALIDHLVEAYAAFEED